VDAVTPGDTDPGDTDPRDTDPVRARRARWARAAAVGQRTGYAAFAVAVAAFALGATTGLSSAVVVVVISALALGSLLLAPAIVLGYAVRAAERDDRERGR
jgi:hypothetical protein